MKQKLRCGIWRLFEKWKKSQHTKTVIGSGVQLLVKMFKITYSALFACLIAQFCIESFNR